MFVPRQERVRHAPERGWKRIGQADPFFLCYQLGRSPPSGELRNDGRCKAVKSEVLTPGLVSMNLNEWLVHSLISHPNRRCLVRIS